jgi:peptidoglycan/LPS O-acetylase OafA/YrhL
MGTMRLLLALAVVFGHAPGWGQIQQNATDPIRPIAPYYAVQAFFVLSGFYMEMVRSRYSAADRWIFWSNRYSRLICSYLVVVFITVLAASLYPDRAPTFQSYQPNGFVERAALFIANFSIFGTDIVAFLDVKSLAGLVVPQSWSLGVELLFYLLVPFLWITPTRYILLIIGASLALRAGIFASSLPAFPWQQRFFPSEVAFFFLGMLSYRHRQSLISVMPNFVALPIVVIGALFSGWLNSSNTLTFSIAMGFLLCLTLPAVWETSRTRKFDRLIGELSYPIYLVHISVGYFFLPAQSMWHGGLLVLLSIAAAIPLYFFIDRPLDSWREKRRRRSKEALALSGSAL